MADKKKNTGRPSSQTTRASLKTGEKVQPVKSISEMAQDAKETTATTKPEGKTAVKSISEMARDEVKASTKAKPESKTPVRSVVRAEPKKEQRTAVRQDRKEPAWLLRFRNSRVGRFVFEAYYELRHKVTWPTFEEARNMTIIVIVLSLVIGLALFAVDSGLYQLFILISGGK